MTALLCCVASSTHAQGPVFFTHISEIGVGYASVQTNATSFSRDSSATFGDQQFVTYYEPESEGGNVVVAQHTIGSDVWRLNSTSFVPDKIYDAHDNIGIAIDGDGIAHLSWGHHNDPLNYAQSSAPITSPSAPITFNSLGTAGMTGNETKITYPEFVNLPDGDLLFFYRNGSSGDGDLRFNRYDTATDTWSVVQLPLIDGTVPSDPSSSNAYWNTPIVDGNGDLQLTWLFRWNTNTVTPFLGFQTNHDIYYAKSTDKGSSWQKSDGTPYSLPITQSASDQVVPIAQGSSLMNQNSMAVDSQNNGVVATWWAPEAASGNHVRQYMLAWSDGTDWHTSQITNFTTDYDNGATPIPETELQSYSMARPVVLVDDEDRVLVLIRDYRLGNKLMLAHSTDRQTWEFLTLDDTNLGLWEPSYDTLRWERDGVISMLYQPEGLGPTSSTVSLFEFDADGFFASNLHPFGDLNYDDSVDDLDWVILRNASQTDLSSLEPMDAYQLGDLDGDRDNDIHDFILFKEAYELAHPEEGAFAAMLASTTVPEPGSFVSLATGLAGLAVRRKRANHDWQRLGRASRRTGTHDFAPGLARYYALNDSQLEKTK